MEGGADAGPAEARARTGPAAPRVAWGVRGLRSNFRTADDPDARRYPEGYPPEDPRWTHDHMTWSLTDPEVVGEAPKDHDEALTKKLSDEYEQWLAAREAGECARPEDLLLEGVRAELGEEGPPSCSMRLKCPT